MNRYWRRSRERTGARMHQFTYTVSCLRMTLWVIFLGMPGLDGPLVDEEGFPRSDIDVHAIRDARHQLACLKTDYRELQRRLEDILFRIHGGADRRNADDQPDAVSGGHQQRTEETSNQQQEQPPRLLEGKRLKLSIFPISTYFLSYFTVCS